MDPLDGSVPPNNWHIHNYGGAQGDVWWMGDPDLASGSNIGGYYDHQYLVLDTPARTIASGNATLTFKMATGLESVGGTGEYNGWDSFNVRVSTNNGTTWTVLTPTTPVYDFTSSYAFGFEQAKVSEFPAGVACTLPGPLLAWIFQPTLARASRSVSPLPPTRLIRPATTLPSSA